MAKMTAEERKWISEWKIKHYLIDRIGLLLMFIGAIIAEAIIDKPSVIQFIMIATFIFGLLLFCSRILLLPLDFLLGATTVEGYYASIMLPSLIQRGMYPDIQKAQ